MKLNVDEREIGGTDRSRTGVHGFAIRCIATLPPRLGRKSAYTSGFYLIKSIMISNVFFRENGWLWDVNKAI